MLGCMPMRHLFLSLLVTVVASSLSVAATKPNIVLIISDDQSWTDYSFMGHPDIKTPHIDKLAGQSALFRRGYVPTALCRPSLATLLTGHYASTHGVTGNDPSPKYAQRNSKLYNERRAQLITYIEKFQTVPALLGEQGYLSHQSGKFWEGSYQHGGFTHGILFGEWWLARTRPARARWRLALLANVLATFLAARSTSRGTPWARS